MNDTVRKEENIHLFLSTLTELFSGEPVSHSKGIFIFAPLAPTGVLEQTAVTLTRTIKKQNKRCRLLNRLCSMRLCQGVNERKTPESRTRLRC